MSAEQTVLANKQLCHLLSLSEQASPAEVTARVRNKVFKAYNYIEGIGDHLHNNHDSGGAPDLSVFACLESENPD